MRSFRAPARVNLIGGQVDYHEGLVVSMAIDHDVVVSVTPRADDRIVATSRELDGTIDIAVATDPSDVTPPWGRLVAGVARTLADAGRPAVGADLRISSTVPIGAGLSSSAAFEVAVALALNDAAEFTVTPVALAQAAQAAEHLALGVPCGIQDQLTSLAGVAGAAIRIDCRTLATEAIPIPKEVAVVVVHSGVERTLEGSPWTARRAESFAVAERLGLRVLRDATPDQVRTEPRGRHVVSEIARVATFADALRAGDVEALGPLLLASHASSRDDMQVSILELDALVDDLMDAGALGARLTGGGFGGCVVALVPAARADAIAQEVARGRQAWVMRAAAGAGAI